MKKCWPRHLHSRLIPCEVTRLGLTCLTWTEKREGPPRDERTSATTIRRVPGYDRHIGIPFSSTAPSRPHVSRTEDHHAKVGRSPRAAIFTDPTDNEACLRLPPTGTFEWRKHRCACRGHQTLWLWRQGVAFAEQRIPLDVRERLAPWYFHGRRRSMRIPSAHRHSPGLTSHSLQGWQELWGCRAPLVQRWRRRIVWEGFGHR